MTPTDPAAGNGHGRRTAAAAAADLSAVFGAPAAALSRRRLRARRRGRARAPDPVEPEIVEDDEAGATGRDEQEAPEARPWIGVVEVRDRQHVDLLLLAAATKGAASAHELVDRVRERSDGLFVLSPGVVVRELHRLENNRLVQVTGEEPVRRYGLTALGDRVLGTRRREWEAFSYGLDRVLDAADDLDRRRDAGRPARAE